MSNKANVKYYSIKELIMALKYIIKNEDVKNKLIKARIDELLAEFEKRAKYLWRGKE